MKELFTGILNISISAGILIVVCILVRWLFKDMPKFVRCIMWLIVAVRLAIPFNIECPLSLLPAKDYVTVGTEYETGFYSDESVITTTEPVNCYIDNKTDNDIAVSRQVDIMFVLSIVWILGVVTVLLYAVITYVRLKKLVADAVRVNGNVFQSERVGTAFVLGVISPKIYIPYGLSPTELYMSLNHERAHIARRDYLVKPIGFVITAVYWFNPFVWLAYFMLCRDIELACDEKVIKKIGYDKKKEYSQVLLNLSIPKKYISACPVAFGEVGINERVKNVLKMKKGKKIFIALAIVICAVLGICFLTYPRTNNDPKDVASVQASVEEDTAALTEESTVTEESTTTEEATVSEASNEKQNNESSKEPLHESYMPDENNEEIKVVKMNTTEDATKEVIWPVNGNASIARASSEEHNGTDFALQEGTEVISVFDGTVEETGYDDSKGNYIVIVDEDGWKVTYEHLQEAPTLAKGDSVKLKDVVGKAGNTGISTGPHLHFGLYDPDGKDEPPVFICGY